MSRVWSWHDIEETRRAEEKERPRDYLDGFAPRPRSGASPTARERALEREWQKLEERMKRHAGSDTKKR